MNVPTPLLEERSVDYEGTVMEKCLLGNKIVFLPQEICEQEEIFKKVMSLETWDSVLSETQRSHLMKFLPSFSENDQDEKKDILRKLFDGENFKFGNPLRTFFKKLHDGVMAPDVAKMTALLRKATYREYRYQQQQYYCRLLQQILISRKKLLDAASTLPPHQHVKIEQFTPKTRDPTLEDRTKWRYFSELQSVREECGELDTSSEDENYPEGSPLKLTKKHKKQLHNLEAALNPDMHRVVSTIATGSGIHNSGSGRFICRSLATCEMTEERYREMIVKHKTRELDRKKHPELDVSNISLEGLIARTNITRRPMSKPLEQHVKKRSKNTEALEKKSKTPRSTTSEPQALDGASGNSQEPIPQPPVVTEASNIKVENKTAPEQPEDDEDMDVDIGSDGEAPFVFPARASTPEQEGNLPVSFFSLLRDLFLSTPEMKMSAVKLEERVRMWLESPVVVGCDWLGGHDNWTELVSSALKFLAGDLIAILPENFVPYLDYKEKQQQWQWIGAGRDSDKQLCALCQQWQENLGDVSTEALESAQGSPPPPRVPTDWSVRPSNEEEKKSYREQECIRYQNPHKAYTFRVHGYEAVVGPVKGVYRKETGVNKAREHSLLVSDRPPFVTILSLVRDAAARLPNGEGTRADISELLKDSQYLAPGSDQQMYAMVSGALDRLHYEKDPCVKYDVNRKLWIYLHRNRTEEEFEKIHQAQAAAAKAKKAIQKTKVSKVKAKETLRPASTLAMSAVIDSAAITTVTDITVNVTSSRSGGSRSQSSPKQGHPAVSRQLVRSLSMPTSTQNNIKANLSGLSLAVSSTATTPILNSPQKHALDATSKALVSPNIISAPKLSTLMSVTATGLPHNGGSNSRPPSQGSSQSLPSPKTVIANVNAAQFMGVTQLQSVVSTGDQPLSSPLTSSTPPSGLTTMDMKPSSPAFVGQPPVLQPVFNQNLPGMVNLTFPTAARGTATAGSRRTSGTSATHSVPTSSTLQNLQTIVVKQEAGGKSNSSVATLPILATGTAASTMRSVANVSKPMVARLVSGSQMVSLGSLVPASAGLVTSQPGMAPAGASTIHIQGNSFVRPVGAAAQLNVLQTNQLATAGVKLNRLTLMTQGSNATTTSLSPNVLISQPKLLSVTQGQLGLLQAAQLEAINSATQVTPIPIPTSHSSSPAKAANSSGPSSSVATSPLPGKPSQTLVMSPKGTNQFAAGGTSVSLGSSLPSVIFATSSPGSSSAVVFACQGSLKTTQTYMMAAPGAPPAVIMATAAQQGIRGAAVTPLNVKALQGIKVIPMSQTVAPVKGCKGQPLFARIITPSGGIALHPTGTVTAGLGQQMTGSAAVSIVQGLGPLPMQSSSSLVVSQSCSPGKSTANTLPATISQPLVVQPTASSTETPTTSKE